MTMLPTLPIVIPMLAAAACLLAWRSVAWQRGVAVVSVLGLLASAVALVVAVDRHPRGRSLQREHGLVGGCDGSGGLSV